MQLGWIESIKRFFQKFSPLIGNSYTLAAMLLLIPLSQATAGTLYIGGTPKTAVTAPTQYHFTPWIAGSDKAIAKFSVKNKPLWASFNTTTGELYGRIATTSIGKYPNIIISAISPTSSAHMAPFTIAISGSSTSSAPTISGAPASSTVSVGGFFGFTPGSSDPAGRTLSFSVNTKPSWASFNTTTGRIQGTPGATNVGTTSNIVITASDGVASASLKPFSITVVAAGANGSATVSWVPPTTDTTGHPLVGLAGYQIKYGTSASNLSQTIQVANAGLTRYVVSDLTPGTYYFGVEAYTASGAQSKLSGLASKTLN